MSLCAARPRSDPRRGHSWDTAALRLRQAGWTTPLSREDRARLVTCSFWLGVGASVSEVLPFPQLQVRGRRLLACKGSGVKHQCAVSPVSLTWVPMWPPCSCSLQRVVLELSGDGVADRAPGCAEGPEPHSDAGAATRVHGRALQGVSPGHHPDRQPAEVSGAGAGVGPPPGSSLGSVAGESSTSLVPLGTRSLSLLAFRLHKPNTQ